MHKAVLLLQTDNEVQDGSSHLCKGHDAIDVDGCFHIAVERIPLQVVILIHIETIAIVGHNLEQPKPVSDLEPFSRLSRYKNNLHTDSYSVNLLATIADLQASDLPYKSDTDTYIRALMLEQHALWCKEKTWKCVQQMHLMGGAAYLVQPSLALWRGLAALLRGDHRLHMLDLIFAEVGLADVVHIVRQDVVQDVY